MTDLDASTSSAEHSNVVPLDPPGSRRVVVLRAGLEYPSPLYKTRQRRAGDIITVPLNEATGLMLSGAVDLAPANEAGKE